MKNNMICLAAAAVLMIASGQTASAQYVPTPPIAKPNVLPKPVAGRLIKREPKKEADQSGN
jgi:hypothetical protein